MIVTGDGISQHMVPEKEVCLLRQDEMAVIPSECHDQVEFGKGETSVYVDLVNVPVFVGDVQVSANELLAP